MLNVFLSESKFFITHLLEIEKNTFENNYVTKILFSIWTLLFLQVSVKLLVR